MICIKITLHNIYDLLTYYSSNNYSKNYSDIVISFLQFSLKTIIGVYYTENLQTLRTVIEQNYNLFISLFGYAREYLCLVSNQLTQYLYTTISVQLNFVLTNRQDAYLVSHSEFWNCNLIQQKTKYLISAQSIDSIHLRISLAIRRQWIQSPSRTPLELTNLFYVNFVLMF